MKDSSTIATLGSSSKTITQQLLSLSVMIAALGYMVDMYDLFLFSIVRVPSLRSLNLSGDGILKNGLMLLNLQWPASLSVELSGVF